MKILIAEDDSSSRNVLSKFLSQIGHTVIQTANGKEALEFLNKESVHLVLSDIRMPEMDGHELLKNIKNDNRLKDLNVILFTGHGDIKSAVDAMRIGAYDYILKPIEIKELKIIIDRIGEYLDIKRENTILSEKFNRKLKEVTRDMENELLSLKEAYAKEIGLSGIGIFSEKMREIFQLTQTFHKDPETPVLIEGETGTGKEIIAKLIHFGRKITTTPFVGVNCAAISPNLFESEIFGYEPGAFTGGNPKGQKGKLELAQGGTIFLDEITELSIEFQAKLLRVIQEREFYRVGGLKKCKTDARFIVATNQDIRKKVQEGTFRQDLFYRLNIAPVKVPPLRERKEEIFPLSMFFLKEFSNLRKKRFKSISKEASTILQNYNWPGNVRELKNAVDRIVLLWDDKEMKPNHLNFLFFDEKTEKKDIFNKDDLIMPEFSLPLKGFNLNEFILNIIKNALVRNKYNKTETARFLGISRRVLYSYLDKIENDYSPDV